MVYCSSTFFLNQFVAVSEKLKQSRALADLSQDIMSTILTAGIISIGFFSVFSIFVFFCYFFKKILPIVHENMKETVKFEKIYLIIVSFFALLLISIIFNQTNVFYNPSINGQDLCGFQRNIGILYTTDTGYLVGFGNTYLHVNATEWKQPLFSLFAMPFGITAFILSKIFFFVPNAYFIIINVIQIILLQFSLVLISRMAKLNPSNALFFFGISTLSYPVLFFSLNMEQYIFPVFWLVLFIYACIFKKQYQESSFIPASGSMLSSVVLFPLMVNKKDFIEQLKRTAIKFGIATTIFGQLPLFLNIFSSLKKAVAFTGIDLSFTDKLFQYFNFISLCLIKPNIVTDINQYQQFTIHIYTLSSVTAVNIIGVALLLVAIIGFILNHQNNFACICMFWVAYSFVILCIIGWGTSENGLILYSLYFSWAFLCLVFMAIERICDHFSAIKYIIYSIVIIILAVINIAGIYEIIAFGIKYYPVL
jgi:hypothetical protein